MAIGWEIKDSRPLPLPCGQCFGCKADRARLWAIRCRNEAATWTQSTFLTLTYDDEHLPEHNNLRPDDLTKFIKRLRKAFEGVDRKPDGATRPVRYFASAEYGSQTFRPHYHLLLFNHRFPDLTRVATNLSTSQACAALWRHGSNTIGAVTPQSAAYVAGYALKKIYGPAATQKVNTTTGEIVPRQREYTVMSRAPGIGKFWIQKYADDLRRGFMIIDGKQVRIPRYYREYLKKELPGFEDAENERLQEWLHKSDPRERSAERLQIKEKVAKSKRATFSKTELM